MTPTYYFVSIHPQTMSSYLGMGVFRRAVDEGKLKIETIDLRRYAVDKHGSIDDRPYGGGAGMVMRPEPLAQAIQDIRARDPKARVFLPDPKAQLWEHQIAENFSKIETSLIFICGRFEGIDQRFIDHYVNCQYSLGPYIIAGGELAALAMAESIARLRTLDSASLADSYSDSLDGKWEYPQYTRPENFEGHAVPGVLLGGDHGKIAEWRQKHAVSVE